MGLKLGKSFDRNYNLRIPFLNGFYDIGVFFSKNSNFLLFSIDPINQINSSGNKVNMFKNLESSRFCETFIKLHNFRKSTLDIVNQFHEVKPEYFSDISFILNESIQLSKVIVHDKPLYDCLNIYGFTLNSYHDEFIFIITERQNIAKNQGRKIVRTSGLQISTSGALQMMDDFHYESLTAGKEGTITPILDTTKIIKLNEE